jgi:uncharacterized RDD family membrane protein YckC
MNSDADLQGQYAGFVTRMAAYIVDLAVISLSIFLINWVPRVALNSFAFSTDFCASSELAGSICRLAAGALLGLSAIFPSLYLLFFWTLSGQTPGKRLLGLRIVQIDGRRLSFYTALRRLIGYALSILSLGLGFLMILIDDRRQGWHDKFARTCVVYAWPGRQDEQFISKLEKALNARARKQ